MVLFKSLCTWLDNMERVMVLFKSLCTWLDNMERVMVRLRSLRSSLLSISLVTELGTTEKAIRAYSADRE